MAQKIRKAVEGNVVKAEAGIAPIHVLIVDDVARVRQDLKTLLVLAGDADQEKSIEIIGEAENGLEAVEMVEALQPEVVLLDLEMPVMDGWEAARRIKAHCPGCRVIAFSVHDYEGARERANQAGVDGFLVKGVPLDELLQAIWVVRRVGLPMYKERQLQSSDLNRKTRRRKP